MYKKSRKLGKGGAGTVYLGTLGADRVAIKTYNLETVNGIRPEILRETALLSWAKHPNLINLIEVKLSETIEIIMEYGGPCLRDFINNTSIAIRLTRYEKIRNDILAGLEYLHMHNIFHRDIKPSNILVDDHVARLCDFGLTKPVSTQFTPNVGTLNYRAPEIFANNEYNIKSDIWSVGCCFYEYFTKRQLFNGTSEIAVLSSIVRIVPVNQDSLTRMKLDIINPINCNTTKYFRLAPLYDETLTNIEARKNLDIIKQSIEYLLVFNPEQRPTIYDILNKVPPIYPQPIYVTATNNYRIEDLAKLNGVKHETANLASRIFDTVMDKLMHDSPVDRNHGLRKLDSIAIVCLVLASKYLDIKYLKYKAIAKHDQIKSLLEWEIYCLKATNWLELHFK